jgi:hypothetical protein
MRYYRDEKRYQRGRVARQRNRDRSQKKVKTPGRATGGYIHGDRVLMQLPNSDLVWEGIFQCWAACGTGSWLAGVRVDGDDGVVLVDERCFRHE